MLQISKHKYIQVLNRLQIEYTMNKVVYRIIINVCVAYISCYLIKPSIAVIPKSKIYDYNTIFVLKVFKALSDSTRLIAAIVGTEYDLIEGWLEGLKYARYHFKFDFYRQSWQKIKLTFCDTV